MCGLLAKAVLQQGVMVRELQLGAGKFIGLVKGDRPVLARLSLLAPAIFC